MTDRAKKNEGRPVQPKPCRCHLCSRPADGLLCQQCRDEIDRKDFDRVVKLAGLDRERGQD